MLISKTVKSRDSPGGPVVETASIAGAVALILGWGAKIPHAIWSDQKGFFVNGEF